ncbi:MAG: tyrosine-protein phosphatase [Planctomycetota bacterium]
MKRGWIHWVWPAVLIISLWGIWHEFHEQWFPRNLGPIAEGVVYRSGQIDRRLIHGFLKEHGIERIVVMSNYEFDDPDHVAEKDAAEALGIEVIRHSMRGNGVGTPESYAAVVTLIDDSVRNNIPTLVHCSAGAQRTGGTVAAYRLLVEQADAAEVYDEARSYGWDTDDDHTWPAFLNENMRAIAVLLAEQGVLESVPESLPTFGPG